MRNLIILGLMAAVALPGTVQAQSLGEVRRDQRELREEKQELRDARRSGDRGDIREERRDVREDREELREDRRDYRRSHYVAPYRGWKYRPVNRGYKLRPAFYGSRYVISNPGHYRLRPAARFHQWIRYGDDLLLVNTRNGRVIQVVRNRY